MSTDPDGNTTFYQYNSRGEQVSEVNAAGSRWTWQYDPNGNLISTTDADGRTIDYTYNSLGEVTSETWVGGDYAIDYTYNTLGELTEVTDPDSTYNYTYNSTGQLIQTTNTGTPDVPTTTLNTSYDGFNNLASLSGVVGSTTDFTNAYTYDSLGDMTEVAQTGAGVTSKEAAFTYNDDGQYTAMTLSAGGTDVASAAYGYDGENRLTSLTYTKSSDSSTINSYGFTYNADGQITAETNSDGTIDYTYDHDGQLTGASGSGLPSSNSYSYDANGNRTDTGDTTGINNELTSDGTYDYAYDANGNLITQTTIATGATENFTWDYRNRLTEVTFKNSSGVTTETIQYTYDAFNQRLSQTVKNGSGTVTLAENYVYDGDHLLMVINSSGTVTDRYLFGPGTNQVLADNNSSTGTSWMLADQEGTIRNVVNSGGSVVDHIQYDSYGNVLSQTSESNQPRFGFDGMQLDQATGLYYDNARYYDSSTGRFISQDPIGFAGGTPDLYEYVGNAPTNLTDPSGLGPAGAAPSKEFLKQDEAAKNAPPPNESPSTCQQPPNYVTEPELYQVPDYSPPAAGQTVTILNEGPATPASSPFIGPVTFTLIPQRTNTLAQSAQDDPSIQDMTPEQQNWLNTSNGQYQTALLQTSMQRELLPYEENMLQVLDDEEQGKTVDAALTTFGNSMTDLHEAFEDWAQHKQEEGSQTIAFTKK